MFFGFLTLFGWFIDQNQIKDLLPHREPMLLLDELINIEPKFNNKIIFKVPSKANKKNLKSNIEKIFKVNVIKINIINKKNRTKFTRGRKVKISGFKKAIITLKKGQSIDLTSGI